MPLHYCPQCGSKLQPGFKFCPSCGEKLLSLLDQLEPRSSGVSGVPDAVCELSTQVALMRAAPVLTQEVTTTGKKSLLFSSAVRASSTD